MELKIYNRIILAVSMVLLCSCVFIICYSIKFNGVKIEFDGISDWISSLREGANKQVISSQADSLIKISRIWADFFPANTSNQPI